MKINRASELKQANHDQLLAAALAENANLKETNTVSKKRGIEQKQKLSALHKTALGGEKALEDLNRLTSTQTALRSATSKGG